MLWAPHYTMDDQLMEKMKFDFVKIKFHSSENIESHLYVKLELNSNLIFFFLNGMQIDMKIIENVFYDVRKKTKKKKNFEKTQII
jgi:hypothetical protein